MKRTIIIVSVIIMLMLLPITTIAQENTIINEYKSIDERAQRFLEKLENKYIERFGNKSHISLFNNITKSMYDKFYSEVEYDYCNGYVKVSKADHKINPVFAPTDYYNLVTVLILIAMAIAEICFVMFGHGEIGRTIAFFITGLFMLIPCWLGSWSLVKYHLIDTGALWGALSRWLDEINFDPSGFFYYYGLFGGIIALLLTAPILLLGLPVLLILLPMATVGFVTFARVIYTIELLQLVLDNAIWNNF